MKTRGIALHSIRYSDTGNIVLVYTEEFGRRSYMVHGGAGKKSSRKMSLFQPLNLLMLEVDHKPNREIQRIREVTVLTPLTELHSHISKTVIALFCAEIIYRTVHEEESNLSLFSFLHHSIQVLDLLQAGAENFHLSFLVQFSRHLGFYPTDNFSEENSCFDYRTGHFAPPGPYEQVFDKSVSHHIHRLLMLSYNELDKLELSGNLRSSLLEKLLRFYQFHVEGLGTVKSLKILQEVFA